MTSLPEETLAAVERGLACMVPLALCGIALAAGRRQPRTRPAALLGILLCMPMLLLVQRINLRAGWWSFPQHDGIRVLTMPVELWIGWTILWGALPVLAFPYVAPSATALLFLFLDVIVMPRMKTTVHLGSSWIVGEMVACALVLLPALVLQFLTVRGMRTSLRATLQVVAAAGMFLYLPTELTVAAQYAAWQHALLWSAPMRTLIVLWGWLLALPGLSAVQEFATIGRGTPIPFDPPERLVTTGMYRYVANPIQLSCLLVMLLWALLLRSPSLLMSPFLCAVYSAGIAQWDEAVDLRRRFGASWVRYRACVRPWLLRCTPYAAEEALIYIARDCGPCSAIRCFLESRGPTSLRFLHAEELPAGSITRMRYTCGEESVDGARAFARALEHLHLGWALAGALLRLPVVASLVQLLLDVSGFGPMSCAVE